MPSQCLEHGVDSVKCGVPSSCLWSLVSGSVFCPGSLGGKILVFPTGAHGSEIGETKCSSNNPLMLWPWAISWVTWASSTAKWETWTWWPQCPFCGNTSWSLEDAGQDWKKAGCQEYFMRENAKSWLCEIKQNNVGGGLLIIAKYLKAGCQKESILLGLSTVVS